LAFSWARSDFLGFLVKRQVQISLFLVIPLLLLLFTFGPTFLAASIFSRYLVAAPATTSGSADIQTAIVQVKWVLLVSSVVAVATGAVVAWGLVRQLKQLQEAMRHITAGDLAARVQLDASDEMAGLAQDFNRMVSMLSRNKRFQEQLRRAERLASIGTLAAGVAHEIRNPLASIKGLAQLLQEQPGDPEAKRYADVIAHESDRLNRVVENLLLLSHPGPPAIKPQNLNHLLHRALELTVYERQKKKIRLEETYDPNLPEIPGEGEALLQAFLNLLLNAVQAVPEEGTIRVATQMKQDQIELEVGNSPSHIPAEDLERIFDPFYTTKENSTGLGLTVTHQIIASHGGRIQARSDSGETVFRIELPNDRPTNG
jgi:signal transduction histidine kinase